MKYETFKHMKQAYLGHVDQQRLQHILQDEKDSLLHYEVSELVRRGTTIEPEYYPWNMDMFTTKFRDATPRERLDETVMAFLLRLVAIVQSEMNAQRPKPLFKEKFPEYPHDLDYLECQWLISKTNFGLGPGKSPGTACSKDIYDPGNKRYLKPHVLPARKRRVPAKFNIAEFLREKRENADYQTISTQDRDFIKDLMDDLHEDKVRNDQRSDMALNKIVQMAVILNGVLPYRLMEPHPERNVIH
ncbi:hypothetical protein JTE90_026410 [Oedothorax gibbosus]|uniref:Uncharacterized protein n=1 Tax=Oedothorax gibbosus TaxID=931172 RepID=A0AAV6TGS1_9ARAC|nr:hypothetical protein JTE90_026410 [Oedothorax gibbosus]